MPYIAKYFKDSDGWSVWLFSTLTGDRKDWLADATCKRDAIRFAARYNDKNQVW